LVAGLMAQRMPFIVAELGRNADQFMLHLYAAPAENRNNGSTRPQSASLSRGPVCGQLPLVRAIQSTGASDARSHHLRTK
jgi:hypothetical protein